MAAQPIKVTGLAELQRAFGRADRALRQDLRDALQEAAAPVRSDAQTLAGREISHMKPGSPWTHMRIGIMGGTVVYVAPVERGVKTRGGRSRRRGWDSGPPSFPSLLADKALDPALERNKRQVERRLDQMLKEVERVWERSR